MDDLGYLDGVQWNRCAKDATYTGDEYVIIVQWLARWYGTQS